MAWEIVVGIETHVQLLTRSKIFSGAATAFGAPPNTQASAVDIALPGVLPVLNRAALEHAVRFGLAVGATINRRSVFARKNYFYPDLPKGYQISQYELPVVQGGSLNVLLDDRDKAVRLTRAHLEEDAGKSLHEEALQAHGVRGRGMTGIDLNRAGTPLLEIVSEPDLRGAQEAVAYARALHALVVWIGICDGNMQEGSFRCDANVSVRRRGEKALGTRCELKNLNSFRFMERAIEFEARRQIEILEDGGRVEQETRLYDAERDETRAMRTKEEAQDYRYFPDPDLLPVVISDQFIATVEQHLAKTGTPQSKRVAYALTYGSELAPTELAALTQSRETANYFDEVMKDLTARGCASCAKSVVNFITGEMAARLNETGVSIADAPVKPTVLAQLVSHVAAQQIPVSTAKKIFPQLWDNSQKTVRELLADLDKAPKVPQAMDIVKALFTAAPETSAGTVGATATATVSIANLWQLTDSSEVERVIDDVLKANAKQVADYRAGKEKAFNALVGQVMKATRGKANPAQVNEILRRKLG